MRTGVLLGEWRCLCVCVSGLGWWRQRMPCSARQVQVYVCLRMSSVDWRGGGGECAPLRHEARYKCLCVSVSGLARCNTQNGRHILRLEAPSDCVTQFQGPLGTT